MAESRLFMSIHELEHGHGAEKKRPRWNIRTLDALSHASPETQRIRREQEQQAEEDEDQLLLQVLELAWNWKEQEERLSFNQFCVVLLTLAKMRDENIARFMGKTPGNVRKTRHTAWKKFRKLVSDAGLGW